MLIVGSKAFNYHYPQLNRHINDIDIIGYQSDANVLINNLNPLRIRESNGLVTLIDIQNKTDFFSTKNVEILLADNSPALKKYLEYEEVSDFIKYASPKVLFSLKKSHIHFPIYFNKHISDYAYLQKELGIDYLKDITFLHYKEIEDRIGKLKTPSLNKTVVEFFGQSNGFVKSYFIHDDIHMAVSHYDKPLYLNMQRDITIAKCDKELWDKFTYDDKCKCILEEAYVISLERKILPSIFGGHKWISAIDGLDWALMRICTNLCSGWFRQFAVDNYFEIKKLSNDLYVENFLQKYDNNTICRID